MFQCVALCFIVRQYVTVRYNALQLVAILCLLFEWEIKGNHLFDIIAMDNCYLCFASRYDTEFKL